MRILNISLLLGLVCLSINAQKIIEKNISYKNQPITVDVKFASSIEVKTWDKSTVYFKADITTKDGKHLDAYQLNVKENNNKITITSKAGKLLKTFQKEWYKKDSSKEKNYFNTNEYYQFNYVVYIPKNAQFRVESINGSLKSEYIEGNFTAKLINGNINITKYAGNLKLDTINGEIDINIRDTSVEAETIHGDIYADEKLSLKAKGRYVGQKVYGSTNNPINSLDLNTINGNMYLRI